MENRDIFQKHKVLGIILIVLTVVSAIYGSIVLRGLYLDGALHINCILDKMSHGQFGIYEDFNHHTRFSVNFLAQLPMNIAYFFFGLKSKYWLAFLFTLPLFIFPLLSVYLNYLLSKRTGRYDITLWSLFTYCLLILPSFIFVSVELNTAAIIYFLLLNYLAGSINYEKKDAVFITLLLLFMIKSNESFIFIGYILFFASLFYARREQNSCNKKFKYIIGIGSLLVSLSFTHWVLTKPISSESIRFWGEAVDYFQVMWNMNALITIAGCAMLVGFFFLKKELPTKVKFFVIALFIAILAYLFSDLQSSLDPVYEGHFRTWPYWAVPLIFVGIAISDFFKKQPTKTFLTNMLFVVYLCGISHTIWQINNSYWFNKDFQYLKERIKTSKSVFIVPEDNEDLFDHVFLRRYHWTFSYFNDSLLLNDDYKIKSVLLQPEDEGGLYIIDDERIMVPEDPLHIKNEFWDLTDVVNEMKKSDDFVDPKEIIYE